MSIGHVQALCTLSDAVMCRGGGGAACLPSPESPQTAFLRDQDCEQRSRKAK